MRRGRSDGSHEFYSQRTVRRHGLSRGERKAKNEYLQPKPISMISMKSRSKKCPPGREGYAFFRNPQDRSHAFEATENKVHQNLLKKERKK